VASQSTQRRRDKAEEPRLAAYGFVVYSEVIAALRAITLANLVML
jgi:hypothetical protein